MSNLTLLEITNGDGREAMFIARKLEHTLAPDEERDAYINESTSHYCDADKPDTGYTAEDDILTDEDFS